jgi:PAS domain S-box-containing protein
MNAPSVNGRRAGMPRASGDRPPLDAVQMARLRAEQVRLLYQNLPLGVAAGFVNAVILVFVQLDVIPRNVLLTWLAAMAVVTVMRFGMATIYRHANPPPSDAERWAALFTVGTILSGGAWGMAGIFLFPDDIAHQVFVIFVLAGMTAGAVASFSAMLKVGVLFIMLALTPLTVRLFAEQHEIHIAMGLMAMLFMVLMLVTARRISEMTETTLRLRFENDDLISYLEREKRATEELNLELKHEIGRRARTEAGLRESEARLRALVDNVPDGIITINEEGHLESLNAAAERIFGYAASEMMGFHFKMLLPASERDDYDDFIRERMTMRTGRAIGFGLEITGLRKDGGTFPMELAVSRMRLEDRTLFIGIVRDITERQEIDRLKNQFVSAVSHELRTPLTSVLGSLALLAEGVAGELSERGQSLLNIARSNMERLVRLVGDILDVDEIHAGRMRLDLRPLRLTEALESTLDMHRAHAERQGVALGVADGPRDIQVRADPERLRHVVGHLLSNAIKFSPRGGRVELRAERRDGRARVSVIDRGPGIPPEFHGRLFQPFSQPASGDAGPRGGAGLGLSIARAIVEKHGGSIGFDSPPGGPTCFYFELPEWQDDRR